MSIPSGSIEQMFCDKGPPEGTAAHQVLETQSKFNYQNVLNELMYVYITCRPDIGYAITTLSKFSLGSFTFHYKLLQGLAEYLICTIICDNLSVLKVIKDNCLPTERTRHMDLRFFSIKD